MSEINSTHYNRNENFESDVSIPQFDFEIPEGFFHVKVNFNLPPFTYDIALVVCGAIVLISAFFFFFLYSMGMAIISLISVYFSNKIFSSILSKINFSDFLSYGSEILKKFTKQ